MSDKKHSTHHRSHAESFIDSLNASQRNSLRLLFIQKQHESLHHLLGIQKLIQKEVREAEHLLALARTGRTAELFTH